MSTKPASTKAKKGPPNGFIRLPDVPEPEDMNTYWYFHMRGNALHLAEHLGNEETTLVLSEGYIAVEPTGSRKGLFAPDLLVAFNCRPEACVDRNGYVISEQGKPPDFVLEIGSKTTGKRDATTKRDGYGKLRVREYWRFDPSGGEYHGAPLAGDLLADGAYEPIPIERLDEHTVQGYSAVLDLYLRWERGQLGWYDPATGLHIMRYRDQKARADAAEASRLTAEERVRELEAELERRRRE